MANSDDEGSSNSSSSSGGESERENERGMDRRKSRDEAEQSSSSSDGEGTSESDEEDAAEHCRVNDGQRSLGSDENRSSDSKDRKIPSETVVPASVVNEDPTATSLPAAQVTPPSILTDKTFAELGVVETLVKACEGLGWKTATRIQEQVLPVALAGSDVIGLAETGSGKTAAFCLPLLQNLLAQPPRGTTALILTPTRELAFQIYQVCQALAASMGATAVCVVGGVDRASQAVALARNPHIVIATPGRLLDHLKATKGFHLRHVRCLVMDEADKMLSCDFEQELHQIVDNLPSERQTMLFSATMTSQVQKLQRASLRKDAVKIQVNDKFQTPSQLQQHYLFVPAKYKDTYFTYLVNEFAGKSILVFCATCNNVQRLAYMLRNLGFPACALHGQMAQPKRVGMLQKFASGNRTILICTDVASRGLDLPVVDYVINYDLPGHGKEYIHRVGRTARAGKSGTALSLVTQYDVEVYQRVESLLGKKLPEYKTDEETVLVLLERVSEAQRLATRELKEQLASRGNKGVGQRHRKRKDGDDTNDGGGELEQVLKKQLKRGYAGGSGGHGGALHNQRGSGKRSKKYRR